MTRSGIGPRGGHRLSWTGAVFGIFALLGPDALHAAPAAAPLPFAQSTDGRIEGVVRSSGGAPLEGVRISLVGTSRVTLTDASGRFLIGSVAPGRYTLQVDYIGYAPWTDDVQVGQDGQVVAVTLDQQPLALEGVTVTAENAGRYGAERATAGARIDVPIRDVPQSVQVLPRAVLTDLAMIRPAEISNRVSGVNPIPGYTGGELGVGYFNVRGFDQGFPNVGNLRDGYRDVGYITPRDLANVERVEFLKGPSSVLYGPTGALGGVVNTVTKRPTAVPVREVGIRAGSFGLTRLTLDAGGPLGGSDRLRYRLVGAADQSDSFRDRVSSEGWFIAPSLQWVAGPSTDVLIGAEVIRRDYTTDLGFPVADASFDLPRDRWLGEPDFDRVTGSGFSASFALNHRLGDSWSLRQGFNVTRAEMDSRQTTYFFGFESDGRTIVRGFTRSDEHSRNVTAQTEVTGQFRAGPTRHTLLVGAELAWFSFDYDFLYGNESSIDAFAPQYGDTDTGDFVSFGATDLPNRNVGFFVQDLIELSPSVKLMAGARFDLHDLSRRDRDTDEILEEAEESQISPRVGAVVELGSGASLFAGYATSFVPRIARPDRGESGFDPETGRQVEIGLRQVLGGGRLSYSLVGFNLVRANVLTADPNPPAEFPRRRIATGEQRSRGVELDVTGTPATGWELLANYSFIDGEVTRDEVFEVGSRLVGAARHSGSIWAAYGLSEGGLAGLRLGAGVTAVGEREATLSNDVQVPSYRRVDALLAYGRSRWRVQLNAYNLLDNSIYHPQEQYFIVPEAGRRIDATLSFGF